MDTPEGFDASVKAISDGIDRRDDLIAELCGALETVDAMFSEPGRINRNAVRDKVRHVLAKARGEVA